MIYVCADDYGLCDIASMRIRQCADAGNLNKISVFPNLGAVDLHEILKDDSIWVSLHLNLVEGKCMADPTDIDLLADEKGNLTHTFGGLMRLNLLHRRKFEAQVYQEIKAQVLFWKSILPRGVPFCIDSHQHTHMIPAVFKALMRVLRDENIQPDYMRIPIEPLLPFLKTPSLYFTYSGINIIKQWLLKSLWLVNKRQVKSCSIPTAYFLGILFSGKMDEKRVNKILPEYIKMAERNGCDIEVLFHPGYVTKDELDIKNKNINFEKFYVSKKRKTEFGSVMKISMKEVYNNALPRTRQGGRENQREIGSNY